MLWIQEKERREEVQLRKIKGTVNPADLMTKYLTANRIEDLTRRLGQLTLEGRAAVALDLQRNHASLLRSVGRRAASAPDRLAYKEEVWLG